MRPLAKFPNEEEARRFSFFLKKEGIANSLDMEGNAFALWIEEEDRLANAQKYLEEWKDGKIQLPEVQVEEEAIEKKEEAQEEELIEEIEETKELEKKQKAKAPFTVFFFILCALFYFINLFQTFDLKSPSSGIFLITPIRNQLFFDAPSALAAPTQYLMEHPFDPSKKMEEQSQAVQEAIQEIQTAPTWRGVEVVFEKQEGQKKWFDFPLFEKIRKGELWRLISPSFLHTNFFHILFNILWLWMLGKQVESRLKSFKYLLLVILLSLFTNTLQYLMSGPFFLGYSGVIMGLVGFIWMRQKVAPWEGYPLSKSTILFIFFFILSFFVLQFFSIGLQVVGVHLFSSNIANTAHIGGGILGLILGRLSFFSRRSYER
jgi:GlpG protein